MRASPVLWVALLFAPRAIASPRAILQEGEEIHNALSAGQAGGQSDVRVEVAAEPLAAAVGEPIELSLVLVHPSELVPRLSDSDAGLGERWAVLDAGPTTSLPAPAGGPDAGKLVTRKRWTVVALAPAEVLPSLEIEFERALGGAAAPADGEAAGDTFTVLSAELPISVASELGDATELRPARGFRDDLPVAPPSERLPWWLFAALVPLALLAAAFLVRRARARRAPARALTPLDRLAELAGSVSDDRASLQALYYALTALLREATDQRLGASRAAATDREWLAAVATDARLGEPVKGGLARVLERSEEIKYARHQPTRWAVEETLGAARAVLEAVAANGRPEERA